MRELPPAACGSRGCKHHSPRTHLYVTPVPAQGIDSVLVAHTRPPISGREQLVGGSKRWWWVIDGTRCCHIINISPTYMGGITNAQAEHDGQTRSSHGHRRCRGVLWEGWVGGWVEGVKPTFLGQNMPSVMDASLPKLPTPFFGRLNPPPSPPPPQTQMNPSHAMGRAHFLKSARSYCRKSPKNLHPSAQRANTPIVSGVRCSIRKR